LEILVIRVDKDGLLKNSRPCNHCVESLKMFGIRNIYYSNDHGQIIKERVITLEQTHVSGGQRRYYQHLSDLQELIQVQLKDIKKNKLGNVDIATKILDKKLKSFFIFIVLLVKNEFRA
jgi:hypothetical protein